ncbi:MAG: aldehyde dehydrogenase family protein [Robiginitomaculum sp.]|nr:MAG: aldehyde dehydrogenase family protein [Robiginitomaculum sp.]
MREITEFYINGEWVSPRGTGRMDVINPANEEISGHVALGDASDVDRAAAAAKTAFESFSTTTREERLALLQAIIAAYQARMNDLAEAMTLEMGVPKWLSSTAQAGSALGHFAEAAKILADFEFERPSGNHTLRREPIGVCGLITPWNWPVNQIACKLAPALAVGCTSVWKPSEMSPYSAQIFMEVLHEAGVPAGVVNLVHGDGPTVGAAISAHPDIDMVSFTGSTRAGIAVAQAAAPTIKRVSQELGGKSANIILDDLKGEDFAKAVSGGMQSMCINSGQSCNAPSRMLVPASRMDEAAQIAATVANGVEVADPNAEGMVMGPVISANQWNKIQGLMEVAIKEGARVAAGGPGRPEDLNRGYFVRPTVFADVTNDMTIAREEVFGPVLVMIGYDDEDEAVRIANDTPYGLAAYVSGADANRVSTVANKMRAGQVVLNGAALDMSAPFGGYKQSGNGREWGEHGFGEYLETKAVVGN